MRLPLYLLAGALLAGCASHPSPKPSPPPPAATPAPAANAADRANADLLRAAGLADAREFAQAETIASRVITAEGFDALPPATQYQGLAMAGRLALADHRAAQALPLLQRASAMPQSGPLDWYARMIAADLTGDVPEAVVSLRRLLQRWPNFLAAAHGVDERRVAGVVDQVPLSGPDRFALLQGLSSVNFAKEPAHDAWWRDLALLYLARGDQADAVALLGRVKDPYVAISIHADKRFDLIRAQVQARLDVQEVAERKLRALREESARHPDTLEPIAAQVVTLVDSRRAAEALKLADATLVRANAPPAQPFSDYDQQYQWLLSARYEALYELGRRDEALTQLTAASRIPDEGGINVNQLIDLAELLNNLAKPKQARALLEPLRPDDVSPFGMMQLTMQRVYAADQLADADAVASGLAYMREHQSAALESYQEALSATRHEAEAARLLIERLGNPDQRSEALKAVQHYAPSIRPPIAAERARRWQALLAREDVRAAIALVGTVHPYNLRAP